MNYIRANIREEMKDIEVKKIQVRNTSFSMDPKHWGLESKTEMTNTSKHWGLESKTENDENSQTLGTRK